MELTSQEKRGKKGGLSWHGTAGNINAERARERKKGCTSRRDPYLFKQRQRLSRCK